MLHDELIFEAPAEGAAALAREIEQIMRDDSFDPPLVAEAKVLEHWGESYS